MDTARNVKDNSFARDFFRGSFEIIDPTETNISLDVKIIDFKSNGLDKIKKIDSCLFAKRSVGDLESLIEYVFAFIKSMTTTYPSIEGWGYDKVRTGLMNGTRSILLEWRDSKLAGVAILKNDGLEKKICCLRIVEEYQNLGMGVRLFKRSFEELGTDKPLLSVSETVLPKFKKIFDHFGFVKTETYPDKYIKGISEISFNGYLK